MVAGPVLMTSNGLGSTTVAARRCGGPTPVVRTGAWAPCQRLRPSQALLLQGEEQQKFRQNTSVARLALEAVEAVAAALRNFNYGQPSVEDVTSAAATTQGRTLVGAGAQIGRSIFPELVYTVSSVSEWVRLKEEACSEGYLLATIFMSQQSVVPYWKQVSGMMRSCGGANVRTVFVEVQPDFQARLREAVSALTDASVEEANDPNSRWSAPGVGVDVALARLLCRYQLFSVPAMVVGGGSVDAEGHRREFVREVSTKEFRQRLGDWAFFNQLVTANAAPNK